MSGLFNKASLVLVPSGYKAGKVYSEVPTSGDGDLTFTRASDATRVNSDGLIEKVRTNLLLQSNQFDTTWTINGSGTLTSGQGGYDGTNNAWKFDKSASSTYLLQPTTSLGINTFSIYAKAGTNTHIAFWIRNANRGKFFDLANGTVGSDFIGTPIDAQIQSMGNGWYRCSVVVNGADNNCRIYPADADGDVSGTSGNIYIQNAQLETGDIATEYIPTTNSARTTFAGITQDGTSASNVPRLDYSQGSCPALLLEPQRTNLQTQSNGFLSNWTKNEVNTSVGESTLISGETTILMTETATNAVHRVVSVSLVSLTIGSVYTISFYAKSNGTRNIGLRTGFTGSSANIIFNPNTQTAVSVPAGFTTNITAANDGYYRYSITATAGAALDLISVVMFDGTALVYEGTTESIYISAIQTELGSYATSYIPTTSATVTRLADAFTRNNIYTNGLITSSGGTWFVELKNNVSYTRDAFSNAIQLADNTVTGGTSGNGFIIRRNDLNSNRLNIQKVIGGTPSMLFQTLTDTIKIAIKWDGTTADLFVNGVKEVSATAFTTTNMEFLNAYGVDVPKYIQAMALFPEPMSDVDCEVLTGEIYTSYSEMATALGYTII